MKFYIIAGTILLSEMIIILDKIICFIVFILMLLLNIRFIL